METKRMNIKVHLLLITFLLCSICGCKTNNSNLTKITDQRTRLEALGVSLLPPQEDGWHYAKIHPARIEFGKIGNQKGQSFAGMIVLSKLPDVGSEKEFLDVISKQRKRDSGNPRYEDLLNDYDNETTKLMDFIHLDKRNQIIADVIEKYRPGLAKEGKDGLHFFKGQIGRFRDHFSLGEQTRISEKLAPYLEKMGYKI